MAQHLDEECGIKGHFKGDLHTCRHFDDVRYPRAWHLAPPLSPLPPPPSPPSRTMLPVPPPQG